MSVFKTRKDQISLGDELNPLLRGDIGVCLMNFDKIIKFKIGHELNKTHDQKIRLRFFAFTFPLSSHTWSRFFRGGEFYASIL